MSDQLSNQSDSSVNQRVVCARCARIKQACDGRSPCSRCKRLDVVCEPNASADRAPSSGAENDRPVKITRTHTGCQNCRRRRKKCDEMKPKCSDCRRLCHECIWPAPTSGTRRAPKLQPVERHSQASETEVDDPYDVQISDQEMLNFDLDLLNETADSTGSEDWTALWPVISESQQMFTSSETDSSASPDPELSLVMLSAAPNIILDEDKSLLNHYMKVVAGVLSRRDDQRSNPYLSKVLPMAFSNQLVMNAVLALSANHWKKLQPMVWKRGTIHQTNALQSLAKLLPHIDSSSTDAALLSTLLLCMIEVFDGTSSHWKFHLDGARRLLSAFDQKPGWSKRTEFMPFYRQLYHYIDSATTISTCHPPLLEAPKNDSASASTSGMGSPRYDIDDEQALYGVPKSLFHFVDKINSLAYQRKFRDDPVFENMFLASAASLGKELEQWSQDWHSNEGGVSSTPDEVAVQHAATAFEEALQLRLHQVVNGYSLDHVKVGQCVSKILDAVQQIRYGNPLESSLVFLLVMAGSSCSTEGERLIVRDRFLIMERTLGFRYVYTAHELVQRVWKQRDRSQGTDQDVNWAAIRYFQIPGLALV